MRVLHIKYNLCLGGVDNLLYALCSVWARDKNNEHIVISLTDNKYFDFDRLGIACYIYPIRARYLLWRIINLPWQILNLLWRTLNLWRKIKTIQPDIIKVWAYHACPFTYVTAGAKIPQIWGFHSENPPTDSIMKLQLPLALLPKLQTDSKPHKIIFTSNDSMKNHLAYGYMVEKATLIHNGIDTQKFHPSQKMKADKRKELGIEEDNFLIGNFSRFDKIKNYPLLANVFAEILNKHDKARLILAGTFMDSQNAELMALFSDPIFQGKVLFLGEQRDMAPLFNALDCFVLTSHSETGPLVLLEAAACGVPSLTTNVGISKLILDEQFVIDSGEVQDFVDGIEKIMSWSSEELQQYATDAHQRVQDNHSIETTAEKYMELFKQALE